MEIKEITNKQEWEGFLGTCPQKTFLQSWNWGQFQESLGSKIWRFGVYATATGGVPSEGGKNGLIAVALTIRHKARRGSFLLVPHGPVTNNGNKVVILKALKEKLVALAKQEQLDFVRISPIWERTPENEKLFDDLGGRLRALHTHPESSWKLDIIPDEQRLMDGMRKTTRYLVQKAQKDKNIEIVQSHDIADIDVFNKMHLEVVKTQKFVPFSLDYFKKEFTAFNQDNQIALFFAKYKGQVVAASYGIFWQDQAFYHHAALLPEFRKLPVSYLLQWEAIKEAKKRGCKTYDFWGYSDPAKYPKHPYSGPTLFKMGFGGYCQEYVKTRDFVISPKYWISYIIETARRLHRGL